MHQEVEADDPVKRLIKERNSLMNNYRSATQHAVRALDYYQRFNRVEDWSEDDTQDYIKILQGDSRRFLREVAIDVRRMRNRLDIINNALMDVVEKGKKTDGKQKSGE